MWRCIRDLELPCHAIVGFRETRSPVYMLVTALYFASQVRLWKEGKDSTIDTHFDLRTLIQEYRFRLVGLALPLSYSHLLFSPTLVPRPVDGLGVLGAPRMLTSFPVPGPSGEGEP